MSAYHVANAENLIKLDAMENPYNWPTDIEERWLDTLRHCAINRYPDPEAKDLLAALRQSINLNERQSLLLGNGSDEIIQILLMALPTGSCVLAPEPGFVMYRQVALSLGLGYQGVPLLADSFELDMPAMLTAIEKNRPAVIFLAYPNNPTGNLFDRKNIETILKAAPGLVIVDEAYAPFTDESFLSELDQHDNLLVMRTVSKLGLAGLRLGYLVGSPMLLTQFNKIRLPYNINVLSQITARFALQNSQFLLQQTQTIRQQRQSVFNALQTKASLQVYPSAANFLMFRSLEKPASQIFSDLKQHGILIKNLSPQGGLLSNCLRVTIGTEQENQAFLNALDAILD